MAEIKKGGKLFLFLSSFTPLWLIFLGNVIIQNGFVWYPLSLDEPRYLILASIFLGLLIISLIATLAFVREIKQGKNLRPFTIVTKENITKEYAAYVITYIIPFLTNDFDDAKLFGLGVLMFFIGILYVRSNLVYVNPMFALFRYGLFSVTDENQNKIHLLSKTPPIVNDEIFIGRIDTGFYVRKNKE